MSSSSSTPRSTAGAIPAASSGPHGAGIGHAACQGLTIVHFSAQPEPFYHCQTDANQHIPQKVLTLS
jgi:hypothetical protein